MSGASASSTFRERDRLIEAPRDFGQVSVVTRVYAAATNTMIDP